MILVSFFEIPNQKSVNQEKPISFDQLRPSVVQNCPKWTTLGLSWSNEIGFSWFTDFWLGISKNDTNIIWTSIKNTLNFKVTGVWLKNWACHAHLKLKIEKGMTGLILKPHPPNFQNQDNFWRWSNDITMIFFKSLMVLELAKNPFT